MKKWAFDPKNDENRPLKFMMSQGTNWRGKEKTKVSPQYVVR